MNLLNNLQTNSNFFYFKDSFNIELKNYKSYKIKNINKTLDQYILDTVIQKVVFRENTSYISINTNKGTFLLSNVTNDISKDEIINILNNNSSNSTSFYFNNIDYFNYARFAVSKDNKIQRYLSYNSEAKDNENIVEWIGKPHDWEYDTHTFYSKKKLEDCEMFFDSDTICEMIIFYLPFIKGDLEINELVIYTNENKLISQIKKGINPIYLSLSENDILDTYNHINNFGINRLTISTYLFNDRLIVNDYMIHIDNTKEADSVFSSKLRIDILNNRLHKEVLFHNSLIEAFNGIKNAKFIDLKKVAPLIKRMPDNEIKKSYVFITFINKKRLKIEFCSLKNGTSTSIYLGKKLNKKITSKIYTEIMKV